MESFITLSIPCWILPSCLVFHNPFSFYLSIPCWILLSSGNVIVALEFEALNSLLDTSTPNTRQILQRPSSQFLAGYFKVKGKLYVYEQYTLNSLLDTSLWPNPPRRMLVISSQFLAGYFWCGPSRQVLPGNLSIPCWILPASNRLTTSLRLVSQFLAGYFCVHPIR